jgi:hypothetical protein
MCCKTVIFEKDQAHVTFPLSTIVTTETNLSTPPLILTLSTESKRYFFDHIFYKLYKTNCHPQSREYIAESSEA